MPLPAVLIATGKAPPVVQLEPSNSSVFATIPGGPASPPIAKPDVLLPPQPAIPFLAVLKFGVAVHVEPLNDSDAFDLGPPGTSPPKHNAEVEVPAPAKAYLAVFIVGFAVHEEPSYSSTLSL